LGSVKNTVSQSVSTAQSAVATVNNISNPGGVTTVATVMSQAKQVSSLTNSAGQLINNGSLSVSTPDNGYGTSGLPPLSVGV
jgi:hypothetical protein